MSTYQLPFSTMTEISDASYRSWAIAFTWVIWVVGFCILPLLCWLIADWWWISLTLVWPMTTLFFGYNLVPESPRWLLSTTGRLEEAADIFRKIAKTNEMVLQPNIDQRLEKINEEILAEPKHGYLSFFSTWGIAKKTMLLSISWTSASFVYNQLTINVGNMSGNVFFNFFLLAIVEAPACFLSMGMLVRFFAPISSYKNMIWSSMD